MQAVAGDDGVRQVPSPRSVACHAVTITAFDSCCLNRWLFVLPVPNYLTVVAKPPRRPPRHFCVVCGEAAPYTHPLDGARWATLPRVVFSSFSYTAVKSYARWPDFASSLQKDANATKSTRRLRRGLVSVADRWWRVGGVHRAQPMGQVVNGPRRGPLWKAEGSSLCL